MSTNREGKRRTNSKTRFDKDSKMEKRERDYKEYKDAKGHNDVAWYTRNSQLVLDAGRLSFNVPTGAHIEWDTASTIDNINGAAPANMKLPGVVRLGFVPTYGVCDTADDPLNVAAQNIYSYVRYANSGAKNYNVQDLMLYLMAMDNCYMYYQRMCRAYGIARVYSQLNRHMPRTIAEALHLDLDNIIANLANFRAYINNVGAKLGSLCVPSDMPIFERHMWMCSGVFADAPTPKSQFYVFDPNICGIFKEVTSTTGGSLDVYTFTASPATVTSMIQDMEALLQAIVSSEDSGIISGDIRKAYGDRLFHVTGITDDYTVIPVYNVEVLRQIQNATIVRTVSFPSNHIIIQDLTDNILKTAFSIYVDSAFYEGNRIMTGSDAQPDPGEVLVNSRFMITGPCEHVARSGSPSATNPGRYLMTPTAIGTEVINSCTIYGTPLATAPEFSYVQWYGQDVTASGNTFIFLVNYAYLENFNYHPRVGTLAASIYDSSTDIITQERVRTMQDVDNYAVVNSTVLYNLHNTALLSLFDVPVYGTK